MTKTFSIRRNMSIGQKCAQIVMERIILEETGSAMEFFLGRSTVQDLKVYGRKKTGRQEGLEKEW